MNAHLPLIADIADPQLTQALQHKLDHKTKPLGSLGRIDQQVKALLAYEDADVARSCGHRGIFRCMCRAAQWLQIVNLANPDRLK